MKQAFYSFIILMAILLGDAALFRYSPSTFLTRHVKG